MRITLIHNPGAGVQGDPASEKLVDLLESEGHEVCCPSSNDDALKKALEATADLVVVAGGDGTVSRVAKSMVDRGTPLTVLPAGTANNISRSLGLTQRPWEELVRGWGEARRVKLDVGTASGPWGKRYFVEGVGAGLFARTMPEADASETLGDLEHRDAKVAYALQMLKDRLEAFPVVDLRATLDGKDISGGYVLLEALAVPYVGPNLFLAPDSRHGDGQFDLVLVSEAERSRLEQYLAHW